MFIKKIKLLGFRNYIEADLSLDRNKSIIIGKNAQGKTNLLEVIQILSHGKSRRASKDAELVNFNLKEAFIHVLVENSEKENNLAVALRTTGRRTVKINDVSKKPSELLHNIYSVSFMADDLEIINGSPSIRRNWIDSVITQLERSYSEQLDKFEESLAQRNSFLKKLNDSGVYRANNLNSKQISELEIWDEVFIANANYVSRKRKEYIEKLQPICQVYCQEIANCDLTLNLNYNGKEITHQDLVEQRDKDLIRAITSIGPQRDEIDINLNDKLARAFASQGERRTITLALKLAELELLKQSHGESPILLLDDVLAELDENRQDFLLEAIDKNTQVIITTTHLGKHLEKWSQDSQILEVEAGVIREYSYN